jgi:hypothetical protein
MDVYAGFGGEIGSFGYDLGVLTYQYPVSPEFNFTEAYISGTISVITIGLAYTVDAASGNTVRSDPEFLQGFEHGDVGDPLGAAGAEGDADFRLTVVSNR